MCIRASARASPPLKNTIERASVAYFSPVTTHHKTIALISSTKNAPKSGKKLNTAASPIPANEMCANMSDATDCLLETTIGPNNPVRIAMLVPAKNAYFTNVNVNISIIYILQIFFIFLVSILKSFFAYFFIANSSRQNTESDMSTMLSIS